MSTLHSTSLSRPFWPCEQNGYHHSTPGRFTIKAKDWGRRGIDANLQRLFYRLSQFDHFPHPGKMVSRRLSILESKTFGSLRSSNISYQFIPFLHLLADVRQRTPRVTPADTTCRCSLPPCCRIRRKNKSGMLFVLHTLGFGFSEWAQMTG